MNDIGDSTVAPAQVQQATTQVTAAACTAASTIINARDCELAGFNLADVLEAARLHAR